MRPSGATIWQMHKTHKRAAVTRAILCYTRKMCWHLQSNNSRVFSASCCEQRWWQGHGGGVESLCFSVYLEVRRGPLDGNSSVLHWWTPFNLLLTWHTEDPSTVWPLHKNRNSRSWGSAPTGKDTSQRMRLCPLPVRRQNDPALELIPKPSSKVSDVLLNAQSRNVSWRFVEVPLGLRGSSGPWWWWEREKKRLGPGGTG